MSNIHRPDPVRLKRYYEDTEHLSQSTLKHKVLGVKPPSEQKVSAEGNPVTLGSLLDCMLFTPDHREEMFYVSDMLKKPGGMAATCVEQIFDAREASGRPHVGLTDVASQRDILTAMDAANLYETMLDPALRAAKVGTLQPYYEILQNQKGRKTVSREEYQACVQAKGQILLNSHYARILEAEVVCMQQVVTAKIKGYPCKGLLDLVTVDHETRTVTYYDLKRTTRTKGAFGKHARDYRYDFQLAFYGRLLENAHYLSVGTSTEQFKVDISDYTVKCGGLIVVFVGRETTSVKLFPIRGIDLLIGAHGKEESHEITIAGIVRTITRETIGFDQAIDLYAAGERARDLDTLTIWT